jgi:tetratricopeptide (TPR) repeat protein
MKRPLFFIALVSLASIALAQTESDTAAYREAVAVGNPSGRISALVHFLGEFPHSPFRGGAYNVLFGLYVDQGNEQQALDAAHRYLQTVPPESRMNPYNQFAYELAVRNIGLDSASAYAARAETMARAEGGGALAPILDTRAFVLYRRGDTQAAEKLQDEAIRGHEDDPEYIGHLAMYQEQNVRRRLALATVARAIFLGGGREMDARFNEWISRESQPGKKREALKDSIVMNTVRALTDTLKGTAAFAGKSTAAAFMARTSVRLVEARKLAEEAARSLTDNSPVEDAVAFRQNLAVVTASMGNFREALGMLRSIEDVVSPWSTDFWLALGGIYRRLGENDSAVTAYMNGLTVISPKELRDTLESAYRALHGSTEGLDAGIERIKQSGAAFDPGRYKSKGPGSGKMILAELFTGAECGPCVASDIAFDALREFYPGSDLSILEYHVHIPGPDPLTTNDSWSRYQMYRGGGTPTAVIEGRESILGGGPKYVARNRFNLYKYAIGKYISKEPGVTLSVDVARKGDTLAVQARVGQYRGHAKTGDCVLHVALVQRAVDYTGANGISRHAMVVRQLFGGPSGSPVSASLADETIRLSLSMTDVEGAVKELIRDPKAQPSWPGKKRNFNGWRPLPGVLDRSNLSVVAWVQNESTHEILQSASGDVPAAAHAE